MLMIAFKQGFAHLEGPLPNLLPTWGWGLDFFLSQLSPRYSPFIPYANFWVELCNCFWASSLQEPLTPVISEVLRKDLAELLSLHTFLPIHISYHGSLTTAFSEVTRLMCPTTHITVSRTDFSHPHVVSNLGTIGLKLREGFDAKRRPRRPWTSTTYMQQHRERHAAYLEFLANE